MGPVCRCLFSRVGSEELSIHLQVKTPPGPVHPESESLRAVFPSESEAPFANIEHLTQPIFGLLHKTNKF